MITGNVTSDLGGTVRLLRCGPSGHQPRVRLLIDTGYNGWLSLPPALVTQLGLAWQDRGRAELADGRETVFDVYEATVVWDRRRRLVEKR